MLLKNEGTGEPLCTRVVTAVPLLSIWILRNDRGRNENPISRRSPGRSGRGGKHFRGRSRDKYASSSSARKRIRGRGLDHVSHRGRDRSPRQRDPPPPRLFSSPPAQTDILGGVLVYAYIHNLFAPQQASSPSPPRHGRPQKRPPLSHSSPKTSRTALTSLLDPGRPGGCGGGDGIVGLAADEQNSARRTDDERVATGVLRELARAYVSANRTTQYNTMITFSAPERPAPHRPRADPHDRVVSATLFRLALRVYSSGDISISATILLRRPTARTAEDVATTALHPSAVVYITNPDVIMPTSRRPKPVAYLW